MVSLLSAMNTLFTFQILNETGMYWVFHNVCGFSLCLCHDLDQDCSDLYKTGNSLLGNLVH